MPSLDFHNFSSEESYQLLRQISKEYCPHPILVCHMVNLFHFLEFLNKDYEDNPHLVLVVFHQLAQDLLGDNFLFDFQTKMFPLFLRMLGNLFL